MKQLAILLLLISSLAQGQMKTYVLRLNNLNVAAFVPVNFDTAKTYPVLIFLHGKGENGTDISLVYKQGLPVELRRTGFVPPFEFIAFAPQAQYGGYEGRLPGMVAEVEARYKTSLFSLCGISQGGGSVWEAVTVTSQDFSKKWYAVETTSLGSFQSANIAWIKNTTTKYLTRAGTQSADAGYYGNAVNLHNLINATVTGRSTLTVKNGWGHGGSFTEPYRDTAFWNFMKPSGTTPPVVVPPVVTPPTTSYAQLLKTIDSVIKVKATPVQLPSRIRNDSLVTDKASTTQDGYAGKDLVVKVNDIDANERGHFIFLDNLTKSQAGLILALKTQAEGYESRIRQLEINLEQIGTQLDLNKIKTAAQLQILITALEALKNL